VIFLKVSFLGFLGFRKATRPLCTQPPPAKLYLHNLYTTDPTAMPPKAFKVKASTPPPKIGPPSRKRAISVTTEVIGNKRSRRSIRSAKDQVEEEDEQKGKEEEEEEEEEEEKGEERVQRDMDVDVDMGMDVDKPAKGGRQGKKGKKGGKTAKGKRAEEKRAEEKKYVFILIIFFRKFNRIC
jgi:hypothetical protein